MYLKREQNAAIFVAVSVELAVAVAVVDIDDDCRADSRFVPSPSETVLLCNDVSHWLGANLESTLWLYAVLPHGLNCRPELREGVDGAMSASRVACKVVWFIVKQRQLHASPPANELSWLLEPKFLATPAISNSQSRINVYLSRQGGFEV